MTLRATYVNGVFRPSAPVDLPEHSQVELEARLIEPGAQEKSARDEQAQKEIFEILSRRYHTGQTDTAERHNEHQP